jgi:hypothetical protein
MDHKPATQDTYESILSMYSPLDVKDIITNGASRKAIHHKTEDDVLSWYAEFNEGLHHNLLDSNETVCKQYLFMQHCYNLSEKTHEDQFYFIRDVVWLYIDAVAMDLATEYGLLAKSREEIKDEMLRIDLEHRKAQLKIIDGGKK